ncbi:hypothetical protein KFL_001130250 [Klebsormidium nitens]|uniref:Uncharacterized protein n=1 Tax=Klebsormidium nitens TaxID=105231 RepID=A0A0U9I7A4_KLENI|nr:hypothetical protein KFL_001130250 [Klebsormidium nitens]|eukprot:GAQ82507.1 hypothetical protein KFL_001130250 [Klebsormidium nitens]
MALNARHHAGLRVLGGMQWWQPLAELLNDTLGIAPEVLRKAPPLVAVPSLPYNHQEVNGVACRKVVDCLLSGKSDFNIFRPGGLASGALRRELNVAAASLAIRQLSTSAGGAQPAEPSTEANRTVFHQNDVTTSDVETLLAETSASGVQQPEHTGGSQSLHNTTSSFAEVASSSHTDDGETPRDNEDEVGSVSADERATSALDEGKEEEEKSERKLAEVANEQGGLLPAGKRQEKDPDPEREYYHVLELEETMKILESLRGQDIEVMHVREKCNFTDYMVVVTGRSERHIRGMAEAVVRELSRKCQEVMDGLTPAVEGEPGQNWLLVDAGNIIVHFFTEDERQYYRLEELWGGKTPKKKQYGPYGEVLE